MSIIYNSKTQRQIAMLQTILDMWIRHIYTNDNNNTYQMNNSYTCKQY